MWRTRWVLGAAGLLGILGAAEGARAVTLSSLVSGGNSVTSGGVVYSDFTASGNLPADKVNVTFTSTGIQFSATWTALTAGNDNVVIGYTVGVNPAVGGTLGGSHLSFSGTEILLKSAVTVGDTLTDANTQKQYNMQVYDDGPGGLADNLSNNVTFNPAVTSLRIIKSIDVSAGQGAFTSLNFVDSMNPGDPVSGAVAPAPVVPEPVSLVLLPLALAGWGLRRRFLRGI